VVELQANAISLLEFVPVGLIDVQHRFEILLSRTRSLPISRRFRKFRSERIFRFCGYFS
jgi:hypothetical protein